MVKYNLNFHETFAPDRAYLSKILENADIINELSKEEISEITGIPTGKQSGKVVPHIEYLKFMNLITFNKKNAKYTIKRTPLGNVVYKEDPYLNEKLTGLMLNYFLTSKLYGAQMWYTIFREYVYTYGNNISRKIVTSEIEKYFMKTVKLGPFNSTYTNKNSFVDLELLDINNDYYIFNSSGFDYERLYMYLYTLLVELEEFDDSRKEFTYNEIFDEVKWNIGFQWSKKEATDILEKFESKDLITINRQLSPITILLKVSSRDILNEIYSLLL